MTQEFIGWIPTILGRLSYSKIGHTSQGGQVSRYPHLASNRAFIVRQVRITSDALLPRFRTWFRRLTAIFRTVEEQNAVVVGSFTYYAFAKKLYSVDDNDRGNEELSGFVMFVPMRSDFYYGKWNDLEDAGGESAEEQYNHIRSIVKSHNSYVLERDSLHSGERSAALFSFRLSRDGVVEIRSELIPEAIGFDDGGDDGAKTGIEDLAFQVFAFLKDISHKHQHHSSASDSLLRLQQKDNHGQWAAEIYRELQRAVLTARRMGDECSSRLDALGIACYAEAFWKISHNYNVKLPQLDYGLLRESVNAANAKVESVETRSERFFSRWVGLLGLMLAIVASYHLIHAASTATEILLAPQTSEQVVQELRAEVENFLPPIRFLGHHVFIANGVYDWIITLALWTIIIFVFILGSSQSARRKFNSASKFKLLIPIARTLVFSPDRQVGGLRTVKWTAIATLLGCLCALYLLVR